MIADPAHCRLFATMSIEQNSRRSAIKIIGYLDGERSRPSGVAGRLLTLAEAQAISGRAARCG